MKACIYCKHFEYEEASHYSTLTWDSGYIDCRKGNFGSYDLQDSGSMYEIAQKCTDFELTDDVIEMIKKG